MDKVTGYEPWYPMPSREGVRVNRRARSVSRLWDEQPGRILVRIYDNGQLRSLTHLAAIYEER